MIKYIKIFSLFLIGTLIIPLLFAAQPAAAAPKDWEKIETNSEQVCDLLREEFNDVFSFEDCDESSGVEPSLDFMDASASLDTTAVAEQAWTSKFSLDTRDTDVSRAVAGYIPVCHSNGAVSLSGDAILFREDLEDSQQLYENAVNPVWDKCFIGQEPALLKMLYLQENAFFETKSDYSPDTISSDAADNFMRGFMTEYGIIYIWYDADPQYVPPNQVGSYDSTWRVFLDARKSSWMAAFPDYDFSEWVDLSQITGSNNDAFGDFWLDAVNHNASLYYGDLYKPSDGVLYFRGTFPEGHSGSIGGLSNAVPSDRGFVELPPPFDYQDHVGSCRYRQFGQTIYNPDAVVCNFAGNQNGIGWQNNAAWRIIEWTVTSPRIDYEVDFEDSDNALFYTKFDRSKTYDNSALSYTLVSPSETSIAGEIVEKERERGIDEQEVEDAGGFTSIPDLIDNVVDSVPSVNFTDCDAEGLGWFSCLMQLVQDVFEWIGNMILWVIELVIPIDLNYFSWVQAIFGGFANSDPYYYVFGTVDYSLSRFGGSHEYISSDSMCSSIEGGMGLEIDFCTLRDSPGYSTAMIVFSGIVYIAGFFAIFRILYKFFAPRTTVSDTVSPSTADKKKE